MSTPQVSIIVVAYNMARELPRTIRSLSPGMQQGVSAADYELIVVDNGSTESFAAPACHHWHPHLEIHRMDEPQPSPVAAINTGLELARAELIGVCIDGARLASPGIVRGALEAAQLHARPVIGTANLHLGPDIQRRSIQQGYDKEQEDALLASVDWTQDGYRLFEIATFGGSSPQGWLGPLAETNTLFMRRRTWTALGGYDARFVLPGGGLANLDSWRRACLHPETQVIQLLGEGSFHQLHGGTATNAAEPNYELMHAEYRRIRGHPYERPPVDPILYGRIRPPALRKLDWSLQQALALSQQACATHSDQGA